MPRQQHLGSEKRENRRGPWRGEEKQTEQTQTNLPPWKLPLFKDPHLARSLNAEQRAALLQAGQQVLGNRAVQRLLHPDSEQMTSPVQQQVEEEEETSQAVETAPTPNVQGSMMGQEVKFGPGPHTWEAIASIGQDFAYAYAGEKDLSGVGTQMKAASFGSDFSYTYGGEIPLSGVIAMYKADEFIEQHVEEKEGKWFVVLDKLDMEATYWLNSNTKWNHIKDFPGGSWVAWFNTKGGAKAHEEAELKALSEVWRNTEMNIRGGISKGFKTEKQAARNFTLVSHIEFTKYKTKQLAIRFHANNAGPMAEWDYYRKEYAKYRAERGKTLMSHPHISDLDRSLDNFSSVSGTVDRSRITSAAKAATERIRALEDEERQLVIEDIREGGLGGEWYGRVRSAYAGVRSILRTTSGYEYAFPRDYLSSLKQLQTELRGISVTPSYAFK